MSKYLPRSAVYREQLQQQKRRTYGLKSGFYTAYPNASEDHFVVITSKLQNEEFKATLDSALAQIKQLRERQKALQDSTQGQKT